MKKIIIIQLGIILLSLASDAQITVTPVNTYITCCAIDTATDPYHHDSLDIGNDNVKDLYLIAESVQVMFTSGFYCITNPGNAMENFRVTGLRKGGEIFSDNYNQLTILAENYSDADFWPVNDGIRYLGFRKITGTDTNYGWVKLEYFSVVNTPNLLNDDTIRIIEYAINTVINEPILAGQISPNKLQDIDINKILVVSPNPATDAISIDMERGDTIEEFCIYNQVGAVIQKGEYNNSIDISSFAKGIYHIHIITGKGLLYGKFSKQ